MKKQPANKRITTRTKTAKSSTKPPSSASHGWRIIGQWYVAVPLALVVVFSLGYLARGWVRYHAEPTLVAWSADQSSKVIKGQSSELGDPFNRMGFGNVDKASQCVLTYAKGFSSELSCGTDYKAFSSNINGLKPDLATRGSTLQIALQANGWTSGNTTLAELAGNISKGIDYTPDATYFKVVGKYNCLVSFTTAFSKPKPPAIAGDMSCSRQYGIMGGASSSY